MSEELLTLSIEDAATVATNASGVPVTVADIQSLIKFGLLQVVGENDDRVFEYQVRMVGGSVEPTSNDLFNDEFRGDFSRVELPGHMALHLARNLVVFFVPSAFPTWALLAFIRFIRKRDCSLYDTNASYSLMQIDTNLSVWGGYDCDLSELRKAFKDVLAEDARTLPSESNCVPSIYGSKSRISDFIVSAVRQWLPHGFPICDLMTGTGLIARQLLPTYPVFANDAALFANCLARSQAIVATDLQVETILAAIEQPYAEHFTTLEKIFSAALRVEESFLLGGLSSEHLERYADFCSACTHFVPGVMCENPSDAWPRSVDVGLRERVSQLVVERRSDNHRVPFLLATAYWANCYFGVRQSLEVDSLCYAIRHCSSGETRELIQAVFLAAIEACSSGPHFAQPPTMRAEQQIRRVMKKRSESVMAEFKNRMSAIPLRPARTGYELTVTQLPWIEALDTFARKTDGCGRGVYVDPPYSRLQYSRYYHAFDTLLRYDYPKTIGAGRVSELSKRVSSRFDSRMNSAASEIDAVAQAVSQLGATLFLSYSTGGTVPLEHIYRSFAREFRDVHIDMNRIQHHSQGRHAGAKERIEVVFIGIP